VVAQSRRLQLHLHLVLPRAGLDAPQPTGRRQRGVDPRSRDMKTFLAGLLAKAGLLEWAGDAYLLTEPTQWWSVVRQPRYLASGRGPDGVPLPPLRLRLKVGGTINVDWFLQSGKAGADCLRDTLRRDGVAIDDLPALLEFGCGVGRVLRHLQP